MAGFIKAAEAQAPDIAAVYAGGLIYKPINTFVDNNVPIINSTPQGAGANGKWLKAATYALIGVGALELLDGDMGKYAALAAYGLGSATIAADPMVTGSQRFVPTSSVQSQVVVPVRTPMSLLA